MKIFTDDAYSQRICDLTDELLGEDQRQREAFHVRLDAVEIKTAEMNDRNARLAARCRAAERRVQELTLLCGMKGFAVEMTPDTPAVPAKPGVLTLTKILKS